MPQLNLALQGGGAHGAFTWGVLDRLLEEPDIDIVGVSGTSAGAINAMVLVEGLVERGRDGARAQLDAFWHEVAREGQHSSPLRRSPLSLAADARYSLNGSPSFRATIAAMRSMSPYEFNPQNINPLRDLLNRFINYDLIRKQQHIKLFINTTQVRTGGLRIFREHELTTDVVLASTTLPQLFQTPVIDGEGYWDGGYIANRAIEPMIDETGAQDVLIVQLNPVVVDKLPWTAQEIHDRLNEITFNSSLVSELRFIAERNCWIRNGELSSERHPYIRLHIVHGGHHLGEYCGTSKLLVEKPFFEELKALGRTEADAFLKAHKDSLGVRSTFDYMRLVRSLTHSSKRAGGGAG